MKRISKLLCFMLVLCMLLSSSSVVFAHEHDLPEKGKSAKDASAEEEAPESGRNDHAEWTVMIYLCGTDLESKGEMATTNLEMIANTVPGEDVNVLIETGGTKEWKAKESIGIDIANDRLQRWSYTDEGFTLVDEQENASMAKYTTLSDFIKWGAENYPAEKNLLILWDHGGGSAKGLIVDELHDFATMSLEGLERALKGAGVHFDLLMTDTCLMASLETAQAVSPYADYLLASEEALPGMGSNYEEWLQNLYDEPGCGPIRLGKNICNTTQVMYAENADDASLKGLTFSVIDLSKTDDVADAFNDFMEEVVGLIPDPEAFGTYLRAVNSTDRYMETSMWDLYDLARRGQNGGISKETVLNLQNSVDNAVVANVRGAYHPYAHGLSAFVSYNEDTKKLDRLARTCKNPWQMAFLDAVNLKWDAPEWACEVAGDIPQLKPDDYTVNFDTETTEDQSQNLLKIHSGAKSGGFVRYELQCYNEKMDEWDTLGESEDVDLVESDGEEMTFSADFTGKWPALEGNFLHISTKDVKSNTVLMQASVLAPMVNNTVMKLRIMAAYPESMDGTEDEENSEDEKTEDKKSEDENSEKDDAHTVHYELEGLWDGYDSSTGIADRNTMSLKELEDLGVDFHVCTAVYSDYLGSVGDMRYSDPIPFDTSLSVEDAILPAGKYRLRYTISDMLDRAYYSDFVNLTWDGNKAVYELPPADEDEAEDANN